MQDDGAAISDTDDSAASGHWQLGDKDWRLTDDAPDAATDNSLTETVLEPSLTADDLPLTAHIEARAETETDQTELGAGLDAENVRHDRATPRERGQETDLPETRPQIEPQPHGVESGGPLLRVERRFEREPHQASRGEEEESGDETGHDWRELRR